MTATTQTTPTTRIGFDPNYLEIFEEKVFIEGPQTARRLTNFFTLLLLATIIATYGVLSNSTATVIGAMIVAPLMGPMMAITAAVVMGSSQRAWRALALTVTGIVAVVLFAYLLSWIVPDVTISFSGNGEISSRIKPGLYALLTALGAGAAGAFISSRAEIADSIGGVAIAISLVPPLCVVGIALQEGQLEAAGGAFLLFMTNFLAILLAGGIVLVVVGLGKYASRREQGLTRRRGFILFIAGILIVTIPLSLTSYQGVMRALENSRATSEVQQWLDGTAYQVVLVSVDDQLVTTTVEGSGELKPVQLLANRLNTALDRPVQVKVRMITSQVGASGNP